MSAPHVPRGDPVVGTALRFAQSPFDVLADLERAYGDSVIQLSGPVGTGPYVVFDPALVHQVLVDDHAQYRKPTVRPELADPLVGKGLVTSEGDLWRRQRRTLQPAFFTSRLKTFDDDIVAFTRATTDNWTDGDEFDVLDELSVLTVRLITDLLLGVSLSRADAVAVSDAMATVTDEMAVSPSGVLRPAWLNLPPPAPYRRALRELYDVAGRVMAMHETGGDDVLSLLDRAVAAAPDAFPPDEHRAQLLTMLIAGHETTALALTYALFLLAQHPAERTRLHEEIDRVVDDEPTWADLPALEHTERVIHESLRLLPPVWAMFRQPVVDVRLGDFRLPEGSSVMLPQWAIHRSARHWNHPLAFDPDRWREHTPAEVPAYFPFGAGPRACIGRQLSIVEAKLILATMFAQWDVEVLVDTLPRKAGITMRPTDPVPAVVHRK